MPKISPHLWYDQEAREAAEFYTSVFLNSKIESVTTLHDTPSGDADIVEVMLAGQQFTLLNGGPYFTFNPSISFTVRCQTKEEADDFWLQLSKGGTQLMEFGSYPFSERYGWTTDKFGVSWQVIYVAENSEKQKIIPSLMFTGRVAGQAEAAMKYYTNIFHHAQVDFVSRYTADQKPDVEGTIAHAEFTLENQKFMAMDSALDHAFNFNEAVSLMVHCENQSEIDYYWAKLSAIPEAEQCGWLKDKFGVSWQIVPTVLGKLLKDKDPQQVARLTESFLKMKKFEIAKLHKAAQAITVETVVRAPLETVWKYWNTPEHIRRWAFATDDWEAPAATNDLRVGGALNITMSAKDKSSSFDFVGIYSVVDEHQRIEFDLDDGRHVTVVFTQVPAGVKITETFDPENENSVEVQRSGWQAILDNYKNYVESNF